MPQIARFLLLLLFGDLCTLQEIFSFNQVRCFFPFLWTLFTLFFFSWGGVRLNKLGTSATKWHIVTAPNHRWWMWSSRWNENWRGKPKYREKPGPAPLCPQISLDLGSNPGRRSGRLATNQLNYYTASVDALVWFIVFCVPAPDSFVSCFCCSRPYDDNTETSLLLAYVAWSVSTQIPFYFECSL
jgi:hypothetical protein